MRTLSINTALKSVLSLCMVLLFNHTALGQNKNLGTAGAQFLKIPMGARAAALGGAVTGLSDDATSLFWNPAGITQDHSHSLHVSHIPWMTYFNITAVAYTMNLPQRGTIGIHFRTLGMEKMEITTELEPGGTGEFFDSQDIEAGVSYAVKLIDQFSIGVTSKFIQQRIWNETATGVAVDIGTLYHIDYRNTAIAMSMRNFGPDLQMSGPDLLVFYDASEDYANRMLPANKKTEAYPLPLIFQFGLTSDVINAPFFHSTIGLERVHFNDNDEQVLIGLENTIAQHFVIRGGYRTHSDQASASLGVGLNQRIDKMVIKLDYAFVMHEYLGDTRFLSLNLMF